VNFISVSVADEQDCWFQQDGAMAYTANSTMQMLSYFFGGRINSQNMWPPRSQDLLPPDFYLWGVLKDNVYKINPRTSEELKQNTELCILNVTTEILHWVASNMRKSVNSFIDNRCGHFQHLI
jgi:hypothetical protein